MRQRVEDLGRIMVLIDKALEDEVFSVIEQLPCRRKEFTEWFDNQTEEQRHRILDQFAYGIGRVSDAFYEVLEIAKGWDNLNDPGAP